MPSLSVTAHEINNDHSFISYSWNLSGPTVSDLHECINMLYEMYEQTMQQYKVCNKSKETLHSLFLSFTCASVSLGHRLVLIVTFKTGIYNISGGGNPILIQSDLRYTCACFDIVTIFLAQFITMLVFPLPSSGVLISCYIVTI